ncbi:MAG: hypothetical protein WCI03_11570 [bacterium]
MDEILTRQASRLEDEFFAKKDAILIEQRKKLLAMEHTQAALTAVSGIRNEAILKKLVELNIHPDLLATLTLVPLVEVAWADGEIQEGERKAILAGASKIGMSHGSIDYTILEEWLKQSPPKSLLTAWIHYIEGLCETLTPAESENLKNTLLAQAHAVAESAGGFLGLTSPISNKEKTILDQMTAAFAPKSVL